jgi:type II secretory ATPase GspE/PulE/Tfp pilus assembly ATPase PilB-like protein
VLLGMHAGDTFVALARWVKVCADRVAAMEHLRAVLCQVLLRKLCTNCREAYTPDPQILAKANLTTQTIGKFFRPPTVPLTDEKGHPIICPACQGSGYLGRTAAFELLEVTDEVREAVARRAPLTEIKAACRKNKMMYLQEQALRKVIEGETSVQEILRVSQPPKK